MPELLPPRSSKPVNPDKYTMMWRAPDGTLYDWNDVMRPAGCVMFFVNVKEDKDAKQP